MPLLNNLKPEQMKDLELIRALFVELWAARGRDEGSWRRDDALGRDRPIARMSCSGIASLAGGNGFRLVMARPHHELNALPHSDPFCRVARRIQQPL